MGRAACSGVRHERIVVGGGVGGLIPAGMLGMFDIAIRVTSTRVSYSPGWRATPAVAPEDPLSLAPPAPFDAACSLAPWPLHAARSSTAIAEVIATSVAIDPRHTGPWKVEVLGSATAGDEPVVLFEREFDVFVPSH